MNSSNTFSKSYLILAFIILLAVIIRIYFFVGHIFSDDAYYSYLSYTLQSGNFANDYLGYPVFPLRIAFLGLTSISMMIFGTNEFAVIIFPFLFSILSILLVYKITLLLTDNGNISLTAAFLAALFPTDVIFATIGFPDLINVFFINLGIYFLLKSYYSKNKTSAFIGGFSLFLSMQFKENIYYIIIMFIILLGYYLYKNKRVNYQLLVGILFIVGNYLFEGFIYLLLHNDFLYRVTITNINYKYSYYDFFPYSAHKFSDSKNYFRNLFDQIFLVNAKSIFLRRFYLFLPLVSIVQSYLSFKKKEHAILLFWFWCLAILMIAFTTSFTEYKPLDLARSWYIFPLLMPMLILSSIFINRFSNSVRSLLLIIYSIGSLIMCYNYQTFFDSDNLSALKQFLRDNPAKIIYTDHFTKYSVDLIREYESDYSERIPGKDFSLDNIEEGNWVLFNKEHIAELEMQDYNFPDFSILNSSQFKQVTSFRNFIFYEKQR